jgi:hypothetical protein
MGIRMVMISTDQLTDGQLIDLPPEAGDVNEPFFEPVESWLRRAEPVAQKTAMWRWFATRYEELASSTPNEQGGNYFFGMKDPPVHADKVLRQRFSTLVPSDVLEQLIADVQAKVGNVWAKVELDKLSS